MVKAALNDAREAERAVVIACAPAGARAGFAALLALDRRLGELVAGTGNPLIAQMRLTWWDGALEALATAEPPAEPLLRSLAAEVVPRGVAPAALAAMVEGWDALLEPVLDRAALGRHARARGGTLFAAGASLLGADPSWAATGEGWALAEVARRTAGDEAALAAEMADAALAAAVAPTDRAGRPLGLLASLARLDRAGIAPGSPGRAWRVLRYRLTGR